MILRLSIRAFKNVSPMSSVTSTDGSTFRAWHFFVVLTLVAATAAVLTSRVVTPEHLILLSITVFAAGGTALAIYRMLLPFAGRDTRLSSETLGHRARAALEREKQLVLRSIKELEFDRAMGKLAPGDFEEITARLRLRALRLMQQLDADSVAPRERIERELAERLRGGASSSSPNSLVQDAATEPAPERAAVPAPTPAAVTCASCGVANDVDARFCKACGTRLAAASDAGAGSGAEAGAGAGTSGRAIGVTLLLVGALTAGSVLAPALSRSAFAQMPDLSQMSGQPLPSGDVPVGTVSVRVIRQTMSNNVTGVEVRLEAPPQALTATTDANGRAVFPNVAQGLNWKAIAIVDGERLESQPFTIPSAGGLRMLLVAGLKTAAPGGVAAPGTPGTPGAAPSAGGGAAPGASAQAVPGDVTIGGQSRFVVELAEQMLEIYGLFELTNLSASSVMPAKPIVFDMPVEARTVTVLEGSTPMAQASGNRVTVNGPFAPGVTSVQIAYRYPYSGGRVRVTQALPLPLGQTTVILRKLDGLQFNLANGQGQRDVPLEGRMYVVLNGGALPVGTPIDLTLSGLPHHSPWPTYGAIALGALILIGGGVLVFRGTPSAGREEDARALRVRRTTLFEQLVSLERRRSGKLRDDPGLLARRNELMSQIEALDDALAEQVVVTGKASPGTPSPSPSPSAVTPGAAVADDTKAAASPSGVSVEPRSESLNAGSAAR
jgi:hypothetical protein